ncbi:MAG: glucans biosynthesis glucosyltransferase MdoH [Alphaproteobacteria bacterium]|nr:glucans biosynthesis glucosyltransferase MdoH [Alphaproteobacteria bacterium]MBU1280375.1 glucans biosynthesis glucosyltransferase MdoH [Alphaproteobacteria bacterium]MBU1573956.1 glucans biosynthesis glucosyltransferase MdoH [Alphaproteobacteria bacterium]MBU1830219.1 glucans biosynthesis glucosyltransferase MdoH [Alphaproteobacteria bacterium]MBU2079447.1 glucans biosynthesis glucosyltransferase MdoH [Alphaproteobacteria bacterium]
MSQSTSPSGARSARALALLISVGLGIGAAALFLQFGAADGYQMVDGVRAALVFITTFWLAWGAMQSVEGLMSNRRAPASLNMPLTTRTAILMPVYNEDPAVVFARVAAMDVSLTRLGVAEQFDFAILSDTQNDRVGTEEERWFVRLWEDRGQDARVASGKAPRFFYRRRARNIGRKAGNIQDFFETSGAQYDFALILDADSLMEGETIVEMVRRMQAAPELGLLQTLPRITGARSRFGRAMQFAAGFYSPVFAQGQAAMQGVTGPFWGHNAMVRVRAFAESCALPELSGPPPFGGHILSHDYVEAALLARAGWGVRLDPDLAGSYEEGPENMIDFAKRDRRWCQGNLQHIRVISAPGLKGWSRFVFFQGILSYVAPLFWVMFLASNLYATATAPEPDFFPEPFQLFPVFPSDQTSKAVGVAVGVFGLLVFPKVLILLDAIARGRVAEFGGTVTALRSMITELIQSSINAPIMLMWQTRAVMQVVMGRDGGWPAQTRGDGRLTFPEAYAAGWWIQLWGIVVMALTHSFAPNLMLWVLPIGVPLVVAPLVIWMTSKPSHLPVFLTPEETALPQVITDHRRIVALWDDTSPSVSVPNAQVAEIPA